MSNVARATEDIYSVTITSCSPFNFNTYDKSSEDVYLCVVPVLVEYENKSVNTYAPNLLIL